MAELPVERLSRGARRAAKHALRRVLEAGQRLGVNILPRHYYAEVPDLRRLRRERSWRAPRSMAGVRGVDPDGQLEFVRDCCPQSMVDYLTGRPVHDEARAANGGDGFGPAEAEFLFAFMVRHRPRRVVQIGCGVATAIMQRAAALAESPLALTCVEPFPNAYLRREDGAGAIRLMARPAEDVPLDVLCDLGPGDLLFVDSTHAVRPGGEVNRVLLEVLPRLADGVLVHFHDINFPYDYSRDLLNGDLFFSHEAVLLHALLIDNRRLELAASLSMLHYARRGELQRCLPGYRPALDDDGLERSPGHFPSSVYLRVGARSSNGPLKGGCSHG